jgi:hypothetical protein
MSPSRELVRAIATAVEREGGDIADVEDLVDVWERLASDPHGRVDRMRAENRKRQEDEDARAEEWQA